MAGQFPATPPESPDPDDRRDGVIDRQRRAVHGRQADAEDRPFGAIVAADEDTGGRGEQQTRGTRARVEDDGADRDVGYVGRRPEAVGSSDVPPRFAAISGEEDVPGQVLGIRPEIA